MKLEYQAQDKQDLQMINDAKFEVEQAEAH